MSNYKIGYGNPPRDTQWKAGQSGNPKGRPKKKRNHLIDAYMIATEPVKTNASKSSDSELSALQAGLLKMCQEALRGKRKPLFDLLNLALAHLERINFARLERKNQENPWIPVARMLDLKIIDGNLYFENGEFIRSIEEPEDEKEENDY